MPFRLAVLLTLICTLELGILVENSPPGTKDHHKGDSMNPALFAIFQCALSCWDGLEPTQPRTVIGTIVATFQLITFMES